jgi:hypothetical protein
MFSSSLLVCVACINQLLQQQGLAKGTAQRAGARFSMLAAPLVVCG